MAAQFNFPDYTVAVTCTVARTAHRGSDATVADAAEKTTFGELIDDVRRETAEHYLRDTDISLSHLTRELGYAEQSVLSRSCRRWFSRSPTSHRNALRRRVQ